MSGPKAAASSGTSERTAPSHGVSPENGSNGTDHGAASCLFVAGPAVAGGPIGEHPKLDDLDSGDLKFVIDFRRVYATLLDQWLGCNSQTVLAGKFEHLPLLKKAKPS